jgi:magnesium transporter
MSNSPNQLYKFNREEYKLVENLNDYSPVLSQDFDNEIAWLNIHALPKEEELNALSKLFNIHRLTKEDVLDLNQRPKVEEFENYLYFAVSAVVPSRPGTVKTEQISFILLKNQLLSIQEKRSDHFKAVRDRITNNTGILRTKNADYLLYRLLDCIIDDFWKTVEKVAAEIENLDLEAGSNPSPDILNEISNKKKEIIYLRKTINPFREIMTKLERGFPSFINENNIPYFTDLKDNAQMLVDDLDTHKQVLDNLAQLYYANLSHRMNEIMKMLTMVGSIFIPLTFIAGIYGMNFAIMPELEWEFGYLAIWILMLIVTIGILIYFKRRKWL